MRRSSEPGYLEGCRAGAELADLWACDWPVIDGVRRQEAFYPDIKRLLSQ